MTERWTTIDGVYNMRDLGGLTNTKGEILKRGVFYRSAALDRLTEKGLDELEEKHVSTVVDLRSKKERRLDPDNIPNHCGIQVHHFSMLDHIQSDLAENHNITIQGMDSIYYTILQDYQSTYADIFKVFANAPGASIFHCAVGKDRTGVTAMLLLLLAGVSGTDIIADYSLSKPIPGRDASSNPQAPAFVFEAHPDWMRNTLNWLQKYYGTATRYLLESGANMEDLKTICDMLEVSYTE